MEYRKDIQILRGISVLLVVLYHLELAGFQSGFLGVDVFFVISGFLMAILYDPAHTRDFFIRRGKRLLPAYFVTVLATLVVATIFVSPNEYRSVTKQALFASFFASNIGFWLENSYFSKVAFHPLLHLWSLGVEIQFYLILPLLVWIFKKIKGSYSVLFLGTLALCFFVVELSAKTSFFMMPLRLWEFLIGYGIARRFPKPAVAKESALRWLGLAFVLVLICIPLLHVDGKVESFIYGHPGIWALVISLSTAGVLAFGLPPIIESLRISTVLETLGGYSYSIYLVHFPVIVLFLYRPFSGTILQTTSLWQTAALAGMIIILSMVMHRFVEKRFHVNARTFQLVTGCALATFILIPLGIKLQEYTYSQKEMLIFNAWTDRSEYRCGNTRRIVDPLGITCDITENVTDPVQRIMLVGNSHADSIKTTFASVAEGKNVSVRFVVGNEPIEDDVTAQDIIQEAVIRKTDSIVMHYSRDAISAAEVQQLVSLAEERGIFVVFIMPVPTWPQSVPKLLWENMKANQPLPVQTIQDYETINQELISGLAQIPSKNFRIYQVADLFCHDVCDMVNEAGQPLYFDGGHLTLTGSELLRERFDEVISDLVKVD